MMCVSSVSYTILINRVPSQFFREYLGLRQGCSLSPLLFMLSINGLSINISAAKMRGKFTGHHIKKNVYVSQIMFVDDVLLFGQVSSNQWQHLFHIISKFGDASNLYFNKFKSLLIHASNNQTQIVEIVKNCFVGTFPMDSGFKYLGFNLKPNKYINKVWKWLINKFDRKLSTWSHKWLAIGGRMILAQSVLQNIFVCWMHFFLLPRHIIRIINVIIVKFLQFGTKEDHTIHFMCLGEITQLKEMGNQGLENIKILDQVHQYLVEYY